MIGGIEMVDNENDLFLRECKALVEWFDCRRGQTLKLNDNGINTVIRALQEVQKYREICPPEELKEVMPSLTKYVDDLFSKFSESGFTEKFMEISESALEEFKQYRSIGTVEECREAVERRRAKKPNKKMDVSGRFNRYYCPSCGGYFGNDKRMDGAFLFKEQYCQAENCGQAISWEESEGEDD